ncbi:MAG: hypothetical protein SOV63_03465 [Pyramidobacter porci]|uniref:hypothetical protein n=1 Tax=Pyramidobacter porci TaxID=2605789 RepID=UPI002A75C005|nr:hypothetical protein [Pyramidobacter porci]MDY2647847.1 hypothetical protein [Pyramidobacter porci]
MIKREKYIAPIREFYDSDLIKIITGSRRVCVSGWTSPGRWRLRFSHSILL